MVEKVATYQFSRRFKKEYTNLPGEIQRTFDQKLKLFLQDMSHPSLRVKRIQGTKKSVGGINYHEISLHL